MINYAYHLNHNPIKRTVKRLFNAPFLAVWRKRGYETHIKEGFDYYLIYTGINQ